MPKTEENDLARKLRELRSKRGLPRKRFTAKVGVTFSTVNGREPGRSSPSPLAMRRLLFARAGVVPVGDEPGRDAPGVAEEGLGVQVQGSVPACRHCAAVAGRPEAAEKCREWNVKPGFQFAFSRMVWQAGSVGFGDAPLQNRQGRADDSYRVGFCSGRNCNDCGDKPVTERVFCACVTAQKVLEKRRLHT